MAIIVYPLNGIDYSAEDAETYLCTRTSGVFSAENNFRARVVGSRQIEISPGIAWINNAQFKGKSICVTEPVILDIPLADGNLPRNDRAVLRFDVAENRGKVILLEGEASSAARPPDISRTEQVYDLGLHIVNSPPSSLTVLESHITSTLLDESVCGLMRDGVTGIPTAQLQEQVVALLADLRKAFEAQLKQQDSEFDASLEEQEQEFRTWFDTIKDIIGDDPLTQFADEILNLQNAVGGNAYFAGKGKSVTVRGYGGILGNVIAHGFTEQAGSGDPSPDNVREISVAGIRMQKKVITGLEVGWRETGAGAHKYYACAVFDDLAEAQIDTVKLYSSYLKSERSSSLEAGKPGVFAFNNTVFLKSDGVSTLDEQLEVLKNTNLTVWYVNNSKTGDIYIPIETQGAEYRCECVKINDFLCEGDTVDTNGTESHLKGFVSLTGNENFQPNNQQFWPEGYAQFYAFPVCAAGITDKDSGKCSHAKYAARASDRIPSVTVDNSGGVYIKLPISVCGTTSETIKQYLISQAQNGTPVEIEYELSTEAEQTFDYTEITAVPSGDGTFKVSADCELSVYQKKLQPVAFTGSYKDLKDKPTAADIGALGATEKAESAKTADAATGYAFYMSSINKNAGIEAQKTGVRLSWGTEYSYKLFFGQDPVYNNALGLHASSNGTYTLGNSTARWASIYSTNGTIQTSDATRKEQITALGEKQLAFFEKLRPVSYKLKSGFDDAENHDRLHYGFIAQEVEQAMAECGITAMEFGGLCKDKEVVFAKLNEDGTENVVSQQTGADVYSLRYQEFIALNTAAIQALKAEIAELKNQLNKLTEQLK